VADRTMFLNEAAMEVDIQAVPRASAWIWTGRVLKALLVAFFVLDGGMKVLQLAPALEGTARVGYPTGAVLGIGITLLTCTLLYVVPRTSVLGAILLTAYLGGATATHVRMGEPFLFPVVFGVLVWAALFPSDERLRALLPLRR
jgi:DoxX-like protein